MSRSIDAWALTVWLWNPKPAITKSKSICKSVTNESPMPGTTWTTSERCLDQHDPCCSMLEPNKYRYFYTNVECIENWEACKNKGENCLWSKTAKATRRSSSLYRWTRKEFLGRDGTASDSFYPGCLTPVRSLTQSSAPKTGQQVTRYSSRNINSLPLQRLCVFHKYTAVP